MLTLVGFGVTLLFENALLGLFVDTNAMVESWPEWSQDLPIVLLAGGAAVAIAGVLSWLTATRHWRRLGTILAAAALAVVGGLLATEALGRLATSDVLALVIDDADDAERNLGLFLPVLIAVVTVGLPWIRRSMRPWVVGGTVAYGLSLVFFAVAPPIEIVVSVGVGILIGAGLGLALKTPNMEPDRADLARALTNAGLPIDRLERSAVDARGSTPWSAGTRDGGAIFVKVLGSGHRAADLLYRTYRWIRFRHAGDRRPFVSLRRAVEHEALAALHAGNRGISTPRFLAVADVGGDAILLAYEHVDGRSFDLVAPEQVSDEVLAQVWDHVGHLHEHGIAHRDLRCANLMLDTDGRAHIIDFGFAELSADADQRARDTAELLASTTVLVGQERAVRAAVRGAQPQALVAALPWLQPKAMSAASRAGLGGEQEFEELRDGLRTVLGTEGTEDVKIERVSGRTLLTLVSLGAAAYVLIPIIANSGDLVPTLREADWRWILAALLASVGTYVGATIGILGAVPTPLSRSVVFVSQFASSFTNRVTPAKVGGMATNVRALQKAGVPLATAVSAIGLNTLAGVMIHIPATVALGFIADREVSPISAPSPTAVGWVVVGFALLSVAVLAVPRGRELLTTSLVPALRSAGASIGQVARRPSRLAMLFGGSATVTAMYTIAMAASLAAFGSQLDLVTVAFVYLAGSAVAAAAPTPGGVGATEAALAAGYAVVGVPAQIALSAVLAFRLITFWLPILPGWLAFSWMQRHGRL